MALLHTYSIVALDKKTNQIGVAVQSHWFNVGALCPWVEAGVGAIATQSMVEVSYGPQGLRYLREGKTAIEALDILVKRDPNQNVRQVAMVDAAGIVAVHTGDRCIAEAGHKIGNGFSVQANMMLNDDVWSAMEDAFNSASGKLADRLLTALVGAQAAGGDIRGKQSACILVSDNIRDNEPWKHMATNIRVDDHPEPLKELRRLLDIELAYDLMNEGDELLAKNQNKSARKKYGKAAQFAPEIEELQFWQAVTMADTGLMEEALPIFKEVFKKNRNWALLVQRLPASGLLTDDPEVMKKILSMQQ